MNEQLFRKKSMERVSSPEELDAYIRVANPAIWVVLAAIVVLLAGVCVWGVLGHLDTTLTAAAVCDGETTIVYVKEENIAAMEQGMSVKIGEESWVVTHIAVQPVAVDESFSEYTLHVGGLQLGEWVYALQTDAKLAEGVYSAKIVVESVSPMSFVMN